MQAGIGVDQILVDPSAALVTGHAAAHGGAEIKVDPDIKDGRLFPHKLSQRAGDVELVEWNNPARIGGVELDPAARSAIGKTPWA